MIALGSDHVGLHLKKDVISFLEEKGIAYKDFGTKTTRRTDYPLYAYKAAKAVAAGTCEKAILICGTGVGISIAANKVEGIRAVVCSDCYSAKLSRLHNDTNVLAMGSRVVGTDLALMITEIWLNTPYEGGRHQKRVDMIDKIGEGEEIT